jgi:choline dehydrogenase
MSEQEYDYIVVGAGSAGSALAARLSEDEDKSVLLLEAGPKDTNFWIHLPIGYGKTMFNTKVNWGFHTEPEPHLNNRKIYWPRGKTLGGSSSINGLVYIRGQAEDYDAWARLGNKGWDFKSILPYFRKMEDNERGADKFHGQGGPLAISDMKAKHVLMEAFIKGANAVGIPRNDDFNGATQEGAGYFQLTTRDGWRCSAAKAYLKPNRGRPNLHVETNALTCQVLFDANKKANGVIYFQNGTNVTVKARREVLLCAGAIQSPQILQLSGVGPEDLLKKHDIDVVHNAQGVGKNLQDHLQIRIMFKCTKPVTTNDELRTLWSQAKIGLQWVLFRKGPLSVGIQQGGMFARTSKELTRPNVQFHFGTLTADMTAGKPHDFPGFTMSVCQLQPSSKGELRISSKDPSVPPVIHANYMSTEHDEQTMIAGFKLAREIAATPAMSEFIDQEYNVDPSVQTDAQILEWIRGNGSSIFHPVSTCRMGNDEFAVVDDRLRVRGVKGLRVVDASIMPTQISGNTNAPSMMIAEKAADMIKADNIKGNKTSANAAALADTPLATTP